MDTKTTHTPTPWSTKGRARKDSNFGGYGCIVSGAHNGDHYPSVAKAYGGTKDSREECEANAAHIVRCVNEREELVSALSDAIAALSYIQEFTDEETAGGITERNDTFESLLARLEPVLARAREEG